MAERVDVVIVGGGPAGLSAALVLGRARRRVLLFDSGEYRNAAAHVTHGFLTRDGTPAAEMRRLGREQLQRYETVELRDMAIVDARVISGGFELTPRDGAPVRCRKLLFATGLVDELPRVAGVEALYGRSVFHCPYCDGWELRDQPLALYARGDECAGEMAIEIVQWSRDLVLCSDGPHELSPGWAARRAPRCGRARAKHRAGRG